MSLEPGINRYLCIRPRLQQKTYIFLHLFNSDDSVNGMWSDDSSPYLPNSWGSSCSGCTCRNENGVYELETCTNST